jgi:hypothetical protein
MPQLQRARYLIDSSGALHIFIWFLRQGLVFLKPFGFVLYRTRQWIEKLII